MIRLFSIGMFAALLSGCATLDFTPGAEDDFVCKAVDGVGCISTEEIDRGVVQGKTFKRSSPSPTERFPQRSLIGDAVYRPNGAAQWKDSEILVIRFAAFVDNNSFYHDPSIVRAVMNTGGWK
ncbi:MAG: hypothetical protein COA43_00665 [Robiginitomaculum sp.]|nr:MAG: hypothetical protein COA43_00665 [Robiginitomaculum sp.]